MNGRVSDEVPPSIFYCRRGNDAKETHAEPCVAARRGSLSAAVGDDVGGGCSLRTARRSRGTLQIQCTGELVGIINRFWQCHFLPECAGKFQYDG